MIRRFLTLLPIAAAALLSCGEERVETGGKTNGAESEIGFTTAMETKETKETRAAAVSDRANLAAKGGFRVWAFTHATPWVTSPPKTPLLTNTLVTGNAEGTSWSYADPVMWPSDRYVSFFAYGPAGAATPAGTDANGVPVVEFSVNPAPASQTDLLIAHPVYSQTAASYSGGTPVRIRFEHALSRIMFSGMLAAADDRDIKIKNVRLNGLYYTGSAALDAGGIAWDVNDAMTASYTVGAAELNSVTLTTASQFVTNQNGYLFLMPQSLERASGSGATMTVTLEIDGVAVEYPPSALFSPAVWEPAKTYNYQIIVDGKDLRIIAVEMDTALQDWAVSVYVNPVMMIPDNKDKNDKKIAAAMQTLQLLSTKYSSEPYLGKARCDYFAIYFSGMIDYNITVNMADYPDFSVGDVVMLDAKKLVTVWGYAGEEKGEGTLNGGVYTGNYTLSATYDQSKWELMNAAQPYPDVWSDPAVDATSGPTTKTSANTNNPVAAIQNKGTVILEKIRD